MNCPNLLREAVQAASEETSKGSNSTHIHGSAGEGTVHGINSGLLDKAGDDI